MKNHAHGSSLLIVICFLGIIGVITQKLIQASFLTSRMLQQQINRTQAQVLALNGLTLAIAQITKQPTTKKNNPDYNPKAAALENLLSFLNRQQSFVLSKETDGMDGTINLCISCEEGKLPLQNLIDPSTKKFFKPYEQFLKNTCTSESEKIADFTPQLGIMLQKQSPPLEDPSQIQSIVKQPLFHNPFRPKKTAKNTPQPHNAYVFDLFSLWNTTGKINPLLLSSSCCTALKLKKPFISTRDDKDQKEIYHRIAETISKERGTDWEKNWSVLSPLYGAKPQMPADAASLFSEAVEPTMFSVLSCGIVRGIEQRLYAIIHKRTTPAKQAEQPKEQQGDSAKERKPSITCLNPEASCGVMRMYWIDQFEKYEN